MSRVPSVPSRTGSKLVQIMRELSYHKRATNMKALCLNLIMLAAFASSFGEEPHLEKNPAGYETPVSIETALADLWDDPSEEEDRLALRRLQSLDIKSSLLQYSARKPAPKYAASAFEIAATGKVAKGCKLSWERREFKTTLGGVTAVVSYLDVYMLMGLNRDITPLARDGEWRKVLVRSLPASFDASPSK
jgi:hypothetical protein